MILVDSNIFMYAGGAEHPHKEPSVAYLARIARGEIDAVIDAEVLQEILHRYRALRRWSDGQQVYDLTRQIVPTVLPVTADDLDVARDILDRYERLQARDAVHAAVAAANGIHVICSYDRDFDGLEGLERAEPE
ncbi:MAG: PIN domain-containing protein [Gemmatimonas sp.]|nr:PIN domain-containing protein [Gemmatimonas sp.]